MYPEEIERSNRAVVRIVVFVALLFVFVLWTAHQTERQNKAEFEQSIRHDSLLVAGQYIMSKQTAWGQISMISLGQPEMCGADFKNARIPVMKSVTVGGKITNIAKMEQQQFQPAVLKIASEKGGTHFSFEVPCYFDPFQHKRWQFFPLVSKVTVSGTDNPKLRYTFSP